MKKTILILALAAFTAAPALHAENIQYPPINPALLYWQAAAELPKLTDEQAKDLRGMASGQMPFDAAKAGELLRDAGSLRSAAKAAKSTAPCDWGLPLAEEGPETALPHLSKMQEMGGLAVLKAETAFSQGQTEDGIKWLLITHRMARHAGAGDILVSFLVQNVIETNAIRTAARHCLAWDETTRQAYASALQTLPPLHTVQEAFRGERVLIDWIDRNAKSESQLELLLRGPGLEKPADKETISAEMSALPATLMEWRGLQSHLEAALDKPWKQGDAEIKALNDEAMHSPHYLIRNCLPAILGVAKRSFVLATLHTMLDAALQHGPQLDEAAAGAYRDALEGEPLRLQKGKDGTLTLLAAQQHPDGKNLSLQLGR